VRKKFAKYIKLPLQFRSVSATLAEACCKFAYLIATILQVTSKRAPAATVTAPATEPVRAPAMHDIAAFPTLCGPAKAGRCVVD
jgi:hypothetical protein